MTILSVDDLGLSFGTDVILEHISFSLDESDKLGIIGVNGSGKSSLFRMITGTYEPTEGKVYISKDKTLGILTQDGAFEREGDGTAISLMYHAFPHLLAAEQRLLELESALQDTSRPDYEIVTGEYTRLHERFIRDGGMEFRGRCASILQKLGFSREDGERQIDTFSGGQRTRLALAVVLATEPDILLLDEPTNHLDMETLAWLESFLISYRKCVMVISHDRYFLDRVTGKTLVVENCHAKLYKGNYTQTMQQREQDRALQQKKYDLQQREFARQEAFLDQQRRWNQAHNYVTIRAREKLLAKIERVAKPESAPKPIKMRFTSALPSGNDVLTVKGLGMKFGQKEIFSDVSFALKKNDRMLVVGPNGCGKSTMIKLILDKLVPTAGKIEAGYNVKVGYYDQENQNLDPENAVIDELWDAYPQKTETEIRNALALFRFVGEDVFKPVAVLSGGERARLTLAKLILSEMNLLILDEPTNHLDIDSREALENALHGFDGTILVVSHDRYLVEKLATRILCLAPGAPFTGDVLDYFVDHPGEGYTEYERYVQARRAEMTLPEDAGEKVEASSAKMQYLKNKQDVAAERKRLRRIEKLHAECEALEAELAEIEQALYGDAATDYERVAALDARKSEIEEQLMLDYEELEELEA